MFHELTNGSHRIGTYGSLSREDLVEIIYKIYGSLSRDYLIETIYEIVVTIMHLQLEYILFLPLYFLLYIKKIEKLSFSIA